MQHVVVVDDAETNVEILSAIVADIPDTEARPFTSSRDALAWAAENHVDAFLLDYNMPQPDGLAMIRILRADPQYAFVPIVIVTAEHEFSVRLEALTAGANDFLERPIERREVLSRVRTLLSLEATRSGLVAHVGSLEDSLREAERQARAQADRLGTLWRVVNTRHPDRVDALQDVLNEGAAAIRPGQPFLGSVWRVEGDECVLVATARPEDIKRSMPALLKLGARAPLAHLPHKFAVSSGMTLSWDDALNEQALAQLPRVTKAGMRAQIVTPFHVGRTTYVLSFASSEPTTDAFSPDDHTYVGLLAAYFANTIQRVEHSDRLLHQMSHDTLTGVRNRTQFRLDARVLLAQRGSGAVAVIALDGFRAINEEYGHIIGDALLVEVAAALEQGCDENSVVGRLAGDTFGVFLGAIDGIEHARERIGALHNVFTRPFSTGDREGKEFIPLSATIGAAITEGPGDRIDQLLSHADTAVFAAKRRGPGLVEFYRPGMESEASSRARRLTELSQAVARGEFELYFQPHLDLATMTVSGAEALIRWNHPDGGLVVPGAFIPFAEQHGMIRTITRWVMASALDACSKLRTIDPAFRLYFNLSAVDFADTAIVGELRAAGARGTDLSNIGVELTETVAIHDLGAASRTVRHLQELGVRVAIDDFGTGFSSLSLLKRVPFDVIKIDRSFVSEVLTGERDAAITETIIAGGNQLGYETVGEGVETQGQLDWLRAHGCHYVQGYVVAPPQRLDTFLDWLQRPTALA